LDFYESRNNRKKQIFNHTTATLSEARGGLTSISVVNRFGLFAGGYNKSDVYSNLVDIFDYLSGNWSTSMIWK
jgi:hypothetical protein